MRKISHKHPWTFKIVHQYHRCEKCGFIIESREDYEYRLGIYEKELVCTRCHHHFVVSKKMHFDPLFKPPYV